MIDFLRRYAAFVVRHAWLVLIASVAASAVAASGMRSLEVDLDPEKQLPADHPYVMIDRQIRKEFGGKNFIAIALIPRSGTIWTPNVLQTVHALTSDLLNAPGIIRQNVVSLSSPYVRIPVDRGGTLSVDYLMREVPTDARGIEELRDRYRSEPLFRGTVVSDDERAALVLADFYDGTGVAELSATVGDIVDRYRSPELRIALTGQPIAETQEALMVSEQGRYFFGTVCAILIVLYLAFGQLQGVVLPSATALLSTLCALGFMGWFGIPMNSWTAAAPLMVVTVAAGHSAQMLKRYYEEFRRSGDRAAAIIESTGRIGLV
ncbi:MAG: MMPL family transporter, partial [Candidatus Binatia bacterium]